MATLVLTTVGGIFGGPVGAMLGGMAGQVIDRELLFKPRGRHGPRLTELAVQTSSYGMPIPKLFGTMRVAGSVIWATDLVEHRHREGGKGRPTVTSYSYTASFAVALSARPIISVGRIWADGKLLRGVAGDWKAGTGFRLHHGGEDQAADPLIASAEGGAMAPAHRGIAYAVFENLELADFGNRIPSLTFEVTADVGAVDAGAIVEQLTGGQIARGEAGTPIGGYSAYGESQRAAIEPLVEAAGAWPAANETLTLLSGTGAVVEVEVEDAGNLARERSVAAVDRAPRRVMLSHYDPARDYQAGVQAASRPGAGTRERSIELPAALDAAAARQMAAAMLARAELERERRTIRMDWRGLAVAAGSRVRITGEAGEWRVAEWTFEAGGVSIDLIPVASAPVTGGGVPGRVLGATDEIAGATILHAFELPHLGEGLLSSPRLSIAACGERSGWRRAVLAASIDGGLRWEAIGVTAAPAVIGAVEIPAGIASAGIEDRRNTLVVELPHDAIGLASADEVALDAGANLALVGEELLQFGEAQPLGGNRWRLSRLWRGRRGTENHVGSGLPGDRFVLIDAATIASRDAIAGVGTVVTVTATGVGADTANGSATLTGRSVVPPAPVELKAEMLTDGSVMLRWTRRSRTGWRWVDGVDAPMGEERERYQVRIIAAAGESIEMADAPMMAIPAHVVAGSPVTVEVRQAGDHGLSPAATLIF